MNPETDNLDAEWEARQRMQPYVDLAGLPANWPLNTAQAAFLIETAEYRISIDEMYALADSTTIAAVPRNDDGALEWHAVNVKSLICRLELTRQWLPFSTIHAAKFTPAEKLEHLALHRGESAFSDLEGFTVRDLLGWLQTVAHSPPAVQYLAVALREKLTQEGAI